MSFDIYPLHKKIIKQLKRYSLTEKFAKQLKLLCSNPSHPSLHVELLNPKKEGIYSFRIDRRFRGLFHFRKDENAFEILNITVHYQ